MLAKVAHYGGFQSYSDLPYPSLKCGKKTLDSNTVYQETTRKQDELNFYDNAQRYKTIYNKNIASNVQPEDYQYPLRVTKQQIEKPLLSSAGKSISNNTQTLTQSALKETQGRDIKLSDSGIDLHARTIAGLKKNSDPETIKAQEYRSNSEFARTTTSNTNDFEKLRTGTEHWKSSYNASIKDPYQITKATRPEWTLHKEPHTVSNPPLQSEYKTRFGERGENPVDKLKDSTGPKKSQDELKLGTTQSAYHIPGYTGYIPRTVVAPEILDQANGVNERTTFLKQNITENYHKRIPGYSGHKPMNPINDRGNIRPYCFSTDGEAFH